MKQGGTVQCTIASLGPDGAGRTMADGRLLTVKGALPGDEVEVRLSRVREDSAKGKLVRVLRHGVPRIGAACPHTPVCGGCRRQDVPYPRQLELKREQLRTALDAIPGYTPDEIPAVSPSPEVFYYRNKMEYSFDSPPRAGGRVFLGLHEAGRFDRVFDVAACRLQSETANLILDVTRRFAAEHGLSAYGLKSHRGLLRFLTVRTGANTGDLMVNLVTSGELFPDESAWMEQVLAAAPRITTIVRSISDSPGAVATGQERRVLFGNGWITDRIGAFTFRISPDSFFQTNTRQAEHLYETIREFCGLEGTGQLLDLYCGTGTIGIYLSREATSVTGVEAVEEAVADARTNAALNGVTNASFVAGEVERILDDGMGQFDAAVCDPPRPGLHPKAMKRLLRLDIPRIVYVSCNAKALPVDCAAMIDAGYRIRAVRAFDMSPHTPHLETVVLLTRS